MKRMAFAVGLVVLVLGVVLLVRTQTVGVEQELIKLETKWVEDAVKHDVTALEKMLADDFMMTFDGAVYTKAELLEYIKTSLEVFAFVTDEWKVRVYGDAAVVTALNTRKVKSEGKEVVSQDRFTDTWIRRDGRWVCVAAHNSTVPQK